MITGSLTSTLRPIRIGFVIPPWDRQAALEAMRISSFLWGGTYNPIIPYHQRLDRKNPFFMGAKNAREVFDGYLQAYDPDFIVRLGSAKKADLDLGNYREIEAKTILGGVSDDGTPGYGIGLFEILGYLLKEEFRFVRRNDVTFDIPDVADSLLWTSIFGGLPSSLTRDAEDYLKHFPNYQKVSCGQDSYVDLFRSENHFLRRLTNLNIECRVRSFSNDWIYLMDGSSVEDVVFYWNLRALGWRILPVPMVASSIDSVRSFVVTSIEKNYWPHRGNPSLFNHTTLLKAPSLDTKDHEAFADSLKLKPEKGDGFGKLTRQAWIPRVWSEWDRRRNGGGRGEIRVEKREIRLAPVENRFYVPPLMPKFAAEFSRHGTPRCANELEPRVYGETGIYAEVIPQGGPALVQATGGLFVRDLRCSADGPVLLVDHSMFDHRLELPEAESIFKAWFKERGWNVDLSDNGFIVKHILKQFGGIWETNWLTEESVIKLLHEIASKKWLSEDAFRGLVHQTANQIDFADAERLTKWLVDGKVITLGIELQCPQCRQRSWYSVRESDYEVRCDQCLENFALPQASPKEIRWAYRGHGAFTSKYGTQGGLAVILTLRSFNTPSMDQITPMLSFVGTKEDQIAEVDLALLTKRIRGGFPEQNVIFAECKSYNKFSRVDIDKMEHFAQQFPGAAMVFSTLRRELTQNEINMLTRVAKRGWRKRSKGDAFSPLLILTGNELFSYTEPWNTWRKLGGRYARYAHWPYHDEEIEGIARATQGLYLDFDSTEYRRRRIQRR